MSLYPITQLPDNGLTAVDLFCGAGIGAYGIKHAGYNILYGVDNDARAVDTYNANIGNHAICKDIREVQASDIPKHDLMIATPVCKPFSICGARRLTNDEKYGDLLAETIRLFGECKPKALFFENVAGLAIAESLPVFKDFVNTLSSFGYRVYWDVVNCYYLGVPQTRERVLLVAIRNDIPYEFIKPAKLVTGLKTQRDALWDLKELEDDETFNHIASSFPYKVYESFSVNARQSLWDEPAKTVLSHRDSVLLYPEPFYVKGKTHPRKMSVREHLRLQTVGDDFRFPVDVALIEQYNRCSGVPSLVSYKYGQAIANCLLGRTPKLTKAEVPMMKRTRLF